MGSSVKKQVTVEEIAGNLVNFSIDRSELKVILQGLPQEAGINPITLEYEIALLKILSVGWGISFFMGEHPKKKELTEVFWNSIHDFSKNISTATSSSIGKELDYFQILKERIDLYINALNLCSDVSDPTSVIGPTFAEVCGDKENACTILAGSKIFCLSIGTVRDYLESVEIR
ncbi:MAG: hypothetical protein JRG68_04305 [Deltaproteobacteria bacterium]|nr:hypothetical protein [Deltaproteobacteria bacterium]